MFDIDVMLRAPAAGPMTVSELAPASVDKGGQDLEPVTYALVVPTIAAAIDTLDVVIQGSDDDIVFVPVLTFPQVTGLGNNRVLYVTGQIKQRYVRYSATVVGAVPAWGVVQIGAVTGGRYQDW